MPKYYVQRFGDVQWRCLCNLKDKGTWNSHYPLWVNRSISETQKVMDALVRKNCATEKEGFYTITNEGVWQVDQVRNWKISG